MKKIIGIFTSIVFASILFSACTGGSGESYLLKMRLAKGDTFVQNIDMDMNLSMAVMGMSQQMKMNMDVGSRFEVLDSSAAGQELRMTYTSMRMKMDMGAAGAGMNMDSIMNATTQKIVGKSLTLTLKDNKITNVTGADSVIFDDENPSSKEMLDKMFTKENLNQTFGMMFNMYPGKPVKIGDSWDTENEIEMGTMKVKVKTTYTLLSVKDGMAQLDMTGKIDTKGSMNQGGVEIGVDMKGTQKGKASVHQHTGYMHRGNYDMDIDANMDAMGQKMPMTLKAKYTIAGNN